MLQYMADQLLFLFRHQREKRRRERERRDQAVVDRKESPITEMTGEVVSSWIVG